MYVLLYFLSKKKGSSICLSMAVILCAEAVTDASFMAPLVLA